MPNEGFRVGVVFGEDELRSRFDKCRIRCVHVAEAPGEICVGDVRDTEVGQHGMSVGVEEDIGRLQVAVDDSSCVQGAESRKDVVEQVQDVAFGQVLWQ